MSSTTAEIRKNGGSSPARNQRYERLAHHEDDDDVAKHGIDGWKNTDSENENHETSSLMSAEDGIIRTTSWDSDNDQKTTLPESPSSNPMRSSDHSNASGIRTNHHHHHHGPDSSSPHQIMISRSRSHDTADSEHGDFSDWDEDDDDDEGIRRYHTSMIRTDMPLPAEFDNSKQSFVAILWNAFGELRASARQRRAARLLSSSQSCRHRAQALLLTSCCDATDLGILLVAAWLFLWLIVGVGAGMGMAWWLLGLVLFTVRISARRMLEFLCRRKRMRQRLSTSDGVEFGQVAGANTVFRDASVSAGTREDDPGIV